MKAAKLIQLDDGTYAVKPCDVDDDDVQEATPVKTLDEALQMLPEMLQQEYAEDEQAEDAPMMDGEEAFKSGFNQARGVMG